LCEEWEGKKYVDIPKILRMYVRPKAATSGMPELVRVSLAGKEDYSSKSFTGIV